MLSCCCRIVPALADSSSGGCGLGTVWLLKEERRSPCGSLDASLYGSSRPCSGRLIRVALFSHAFSSRPRSFKKPRFTLQGPGGPSKKGSPRDPLPRGRRKPPSSLRPPPCRPHCHKHILPGRSSNTANVPRLFSSQFLFTITSKKNGPATPFAAPQGLLDGLRSFPCSSPLLC